MILVSVASPCAGAKFLATNNGNIEATEIGYDTEFEFAECGAKHCGHAAAVWARLELLLTHRENPSAEVDRSANNPNACPGVAVARGADRACRRRRRAITLAASLPATIERASTDKDDPARRHAAAARATLEGNSVLRGQALGAIVIDGKRDILALVVAHALDFRLGQRRMLRDRIAQVLPAWEAAAPGYASILAMYAFGLGENSHLRAAERMARRALASIRGMPGGVHVIAHVLEMEGGAREGLSFPCRYQGVMGEGTGFSVHLASHQALFHLDAVDPRSALAVYDEQIAKVGAFPTCPCSPMLRRCCRSFNCATSTWADAGGCSEIAG